MAWNVCPIDSWQSWSGGDLPEKRNGIAMAKKKRKPRNTILAIVAKNDPTRFRDRTVSPEKGKGRKERPREFNIDDFFDYAA